MSERAGFLYIVSNSKCSGNCSYSLLIQS